MTWHLGLTRLAPAAAAVGADGWLWAAARAGDASVPAPDPADERDVRRAAGGDEGAFERLVARHQAAVGRLMWRFTRDRDDHEELVQEVFIEAWRSLGSYRGEGSFVGWLRTIGVRLGYASWRRRREPVELCADLTALLDRLAQAEPETAAVEAAETVHALLSRLSARDRLVVTLLHLADCSVDEVARLTGWSRSMVKVQAWRARARLRRMLEAGGER